MKRENEEAVRHLFYLTSGLKSQILAEDQIITQVKDALTLARDAYCTDNVLEVLFRMAVTAAKKVKTEVTFSRANTSVIHQAMERLKNQGFSFEGKSDGTCFKRSRSRRNRNRTSVSKWCCKHSTGM
mgnify:CR=1 FL=1